MVEHAHQAFDAALDGLKATVQSVSARFSDLDVGPDEYEIEFGLTLTAESGVIITSGGVEANFKVTLKWK